MRSRFHWRFSAGITECHEFTLREGFAVHDRIPNFSQRSARAGSKQRPKVVERVFLLLYEFVEESLTLWPLARWRSLQGKDKRPLDSRKQAGDFEFERQASSKKSKDCASRIGLCNEWL